MCFVIQLSLARSISVYVYAEPRSVSPSHLVKHVTAKLFWYDLESISLNIDDLFHAELIDSILHHAVEVDDLATRLAKVVLLGESQGLDNQRFI